MGSQRGDPSRPIGRRSTEHRGMSGVEGYSLPVGSCEARSRASDPQAAVRRPRDKWPRFVARAGMVGVRRWRRPGRVPISEPVVVSSTICAIEVHDVEGSSRPPNLRARWQRRATGTQRTKRPTRTACEDNPAGNGRDRAQSTPAASARADARRRRGIGGRRKGGLLQATVSSRYTALVLHSARRCPAGSLGVLLSGKDRRAGDWGVLMRAPLFRRVGR